MNVYIDCGGWKGNTFEEYYNKNFLVIVFEPNSTYNCFYEPFNIVPINKAVWINDGEIDFYIGTTYDGLGSTVFEDKITSNIRDVKPIKVECFDFSKWILDNFTKDDYIVLKMNIEGAEYPVLNKMIKDGSINYINEFKISYHHHKITSITEKEHNDLVNKLKMINKRKSEDLIIVTIGLIKCRIPNVKLIVDDLMAGTMIPDKIIFCVSKEPFYLDDGIQPHELPKIDNPIVEFKYVENTGPSRRITSVVREYWEQPDTKIIIFDDDRKPGKDNIEKLVNYSNIHPNVAISGAGNIWDHKDVNRKELERMGVVFEPERPLEFGIILGWAIRRTIGVTILNPGMGMLVKPMFFSKEFIDCMSHYDEEIGIKYTDQTFLSYSLAKNNVQRIVIRMGLIGGYPGYGRDLHKAVPGKNYNGTRIRLPHKRLQVRNWAQSLHKKVSPPILVSIYNRLEYVDNIINEFKRTSVDLHLVHFFIDGNDNVEIIKRCKEYRDKYGIHLHINKRVGHKLNFIRMLDRFKNDHKYFFVVEPDIVLSKNWYQYTLKVLEKEKNKDYGVYYLYSGFSVVERNKDLTWKEMKHNKSVGGSCLWLINHKYANLIKNKMLEWNMQPDRTLHRLIIDQKSKEIKRYCFVPSLAQHVGYNSSMKKDYHKAFNFYGKNNDAMRLLKLEYEEKLEILEYPPYSGEGWNIPMLSDNLYHLKRRIEQKNYKIIVELGTLYGYTAINLAKLDCVEKLYTIDLFETLPDNPINYAGWEEREKVFLSFVVKHKLQHKIVPIKGCSWEVGKIFQELGINVDLVYIDACHTYECTKKDIEAWFPITKFICGDDYFISPTWKDGVVKAVDEMAEVYNKEVRNVQSPDVKKKNILWWYEDK